MKIKIRDSQAVWRAWLIAIAFAAAGSSLAQAAPDDRVQSLARQEKQPLLATLKELVAIESGSGDREGLDKISR